MKWKDVREEHLHANMGPRFVGDKIKIQMKETTTNI